MRTEEFILFLSRLACFISWHAVNGDDLIWIASMYGKPNPWVLFCFVAAAKDVGIVILRAKLRCISIPYIWWTVFVSIFVWLWFWWAVNHRNFFINMFFQWIFEMIVFCQACVSVEVECKELILFKISLITCSYIWNFNVKVFIIKFDKICFFVVVQYALEVFVTVFVVKDPDSCAKKEEQKQENKDTYKTSTICWMVFITLVSHSDGLRKVIKLLKEWLFMLLFWTILFCDHWV